MSNATMLATSEESIKQEIKQQTRYIQLKG
jgi:hypothetical protein